MLRVAAPLSGLLLLASCSRPVPPTLAPKSVSVASISATGLLLDVELAATNPNSIALSAEGATANVTIDGSTPLGTATMTSQVTLPAQSTTTVHMPLAVTWDNLGGFIAAAATGRDVPYTVAGAATIGAANIHFGVPFTINGTLTHAQILKVTQASLQAIPGLPDLFGPPKGK
jgi:LEA14-like dessication related protein